MTYHITALPQFKSLNNCARTGVSSAIFDVRFGPLKCFLRILTGLPANVFILRLRTPSPRILCLYEIRHAI